jgi:hypothetical protein
MKYTILVLYCVILASCAIQTKLTEPTSFAILSPDLGSLNKVDVGKTLVSKEIGHKFKSIIFTRSITLNVDDVNKEVKKGEIFINDGHTNDYNLFSNLNDKTFGIAIHKNHETCTVFTKTLNSKIYYGQDVSIEYKDTVISTDLKKLTDKEFIYNGRVNNAVKFTYREYSGYSAEPVFTQDLQYDLNLSKIIGFKELRIEILSATNTHLEYIIKRHFAN